jgi:HAD superfamily hydrolase (TIGR01544 family)
MNIMNSNPDTLEKIKAEIKLGGYTKLHILADFDRTLTYGSINGVKTPAILALLRDGNHLTPDYAEKAHALYDKYSVIEFDPNISKVEKKKAMAQWWELHFKLLIESGLNLKDLEDIVKNGNVLFREGVLEFLDFLHEKNIPIVIMSASGCGDTIPMFFEKYDRKYPNIYYVINEFNWDENGKAVSFKEPVIHTANKDETILKDFPEIYKVIENRKNVILLGDGLDDVGMVEGFDYDNLIKIGFLNFDYTKEEEAYKKIFDIVLEGDKDFGYVNRLLKDLE